MTNIARLRFIESIAKLLFYAAVPTVLAFLGWRFEQRLNNQILRKDFLNFAAQQQSAKLASRVEYTKLAVTILQFPSRDDETDSSLRAWARNWLTSYPGLLWQSVRSDVEPTQDSCPDCLPNLEGYCAAYPESAPIGTPITYEAHATGGNGSYAFIWTGSEGTWNNRIKFQVIYSTLGKKDMTVRIISNGQSVYQTCTVSITEDGPLVFDSE